MEIVLNTYTNSTKFTDQAMGMLSSIAENRKSDFSGTGLVFYTDLEKLPHLQLTTGSEKPRVNQFNDHDIAFALASVSTMSDPFHDGFHFINTHSWQVTHVSQFISPPIPHDATQRFHGTGARLMAAILASILPGITGVGLVSQRGEVHLFYDGVDIAGEN